MTYFIRGSDGKYNEHFPKTATSAIKKAKQIAEVTGKPVDIIKQGNYWKTIQPKAKNPSVKQGQWIKARAVRISKGKLEILK